MNGRVPATVIAVTAERVRTRCPKALIRSNLWDPATHVPKSELPTSGQTLAALKKGFDGEAWDEIYDEGVRKTLY